MTCNHKEDSTGINNHINQLKSIFDEKMRAGGTFEEVKEVYMQIKELRKRLNILNGKTMKSA